jgi:CDP-diacylglycerol pyrophosphatase
MLSRTVSLLCLATTAFAFAAHAAVTELGRAALWKVVQTCVLNHALTGAAFPCLEVNVSDGTERGYAVLRRPFGEPDLILSPTRKIVGVEDPWLGALEAPNYFEEAWGARMFLQGAGKQPPARYDVVLAVNSRTSRTQDQLHIHIGCLSSDAKQTLHALTPSMLTTSWIPLGRPFHGLEFWGRLVSQETLAGVNPFRLAAEAWPGQAKDRSQLTIAAAGIRLANGRDGFVLLASYENPFGRYSAEDFLDNSRHSACA